MQALEGPTAPGPADGHEGSLLSAALRAVARFSSKQPRLTLWLVGLVSCAAVAWTLNALQFKTNRADLINPQAEFHQRWIEYTQRFGDEADIVVVVEAEAAETIKPVLDDLGARMSQEPELFASVAYKVDQGALCSKGLQWLSPAELKAGLRQIAEFEPVLNGRWDLLQLDTQFSRYAHQFDSTKLDTPQQASLIQQADLLTSSLSEFLANPQSFRPPWPAAVSSQALPGSADAGDSYFINAQGTMGFLKARPATTADDFGGNSKPIDRLRELIRQIKPQHEFARIGLTGIPVLESDEMRRSQTDMTWASIISFVGVGIVFAVGFRGLRHPLLAMVVLLVGTACSFGFTTLAVGHLNILSVSFAAILIGLGDFSVHFLAKYFQLRQQGEELEPALVETSSSIGTGTVTAAATTAAAFFCATLTDFLGVAELGVIVGGGILICAAATFIVLPALVALVDANLPASRLPTQFKGNILRGISSRFPLVTLVLSIVVLGVVGSKALVLNGGNVESRVRYDYNLLNLQADGLESVDLQRRIFEQSQDSVLYAVSLADSPAEARALRAKFEALPSVRRVEDLASRLPAHAGHETLSLVQAYRERLSRLPAALPDLAQPDPDVVGRAVEGFYKRVRQVRDSRCQKVAQQTDLFLDEFDKLSLEGQLRFLAAYQGRMAASLFRQFQALAAVSNPEPITWADLPADVRSRFVSRDGKWLVQVYPQAEIWDREPLEQFIADLRTVDPDVTGTPVQNFEAARQVQESYQTAALYALCVICLALLIDFLDGSKKIVVLFPPLALVGSVAAIMQVGRAQIDPLVLLSVYVIAAGVLAAILEKRNVRDAALALLPAMAGGVLMFGIMGIFEIPLNPANLIALPLVLGIGVDNGVHLLHDFSMQQPGRYRTSSSTINGMVITTLTTMVGFGSMIIASHRGLRSVGLVLTIGVGSCLLVALVTVPAILTLVSRSQTREAQPAAVQETVNTLQPSQGAEAA